jgi:hypothetical protein
MTSIERSGVAVAGLVLWYVCRVVRGYGRRQEG